MAPCCWFDGIRLSGNSEIQNRFENMLFISFLKAEILTVVAKLKVLARTMDAHDNSSTVNTLNNSSSGVDLYSSSLIQMMAKCQVNYLTLEYDGTWLHASTFTIKYTMNLKI